MSKSVSVHTLGCRVNMYESCAIAEMLQERGFKVSKNKQCDYYIVNTCAVTAESERKSRQLVRRCSTKGKVLVIGCASQIDSGYKDIENVIYIGGNRNKTAVVECIEQHIKNEFSTVHSVIPMDNAPYEEMSLSGESDVFSECRAFIKIQDGCNGKCTYCIIPKCRGSVRSREAESIISEAKRLVTNGYKEIILTGIEVGAYNKVPLGDLVSMVSKTNGLYRLRLGSLSPNIISERFLSKVSDLDNFMPHIHLSLQSCSDKILTAMKRPYRKKDIYERVSLIRDYIPDCQISADIIVGFPGENEDDFNETVSALKELDIFHVHSFPYSEREGTPAAEMINSVPKSVRSQRNGILIKECQDIKNKILDSKINKKLKVLVEKVNDGVAIGHTEEFLEVKIIGDEFSVGEIVEVKAVSHDEGSLNCELIGRLAK
ncbi:MAG: tRNA (N(6)-L-threonylcarbamoyladenosine(37)-C(2))-methylthiotransferase MtaB [Ruminococcaceae bacterium]|nr:tRNA (N(6)-L-threonylcarbamoyladenosine(37)-C(2))-methylthiotransferase MtaB [Oscillospiraceae bacterium]